MRLLSIQTRMVISLHLRVIGFIVFALLMVAFSIDLASTGKQLINTSQGSLAHTIARYLTYRGVDIVTRLLPMACLAGGLIAELLRRQRMETVILSASGAAPWAMLPALALIGLLLGGLQVVMETHLRPWAVFQQVETGLGRYADRFGPELSQPQWVVKNATALRARIGRDDDPEMADIMVFSGLSNTELSAITMAKSAHSTAVGNQWILRDVMTWQNGADGRMIKQQHHQLVTDLPVTAAELRYFAVPALYLPQRDLRRVLALPRPSGDARTAGLRRYGALFLPGICALLGAALGHAAWRERRLPPLRAVGFGALGYVSVVSVKIFWALGEHDVLPPAWAAFGGMIWMALLASALILRQSLRP